MIDLRSFVFLDSLQPQHAAFLGTVAKGFLPTAHQASLFIEVAPGITINHLTDIAVKATAVTPGMQIVERLYGLLEVHHDEQAEVRRAGEAILEEIGKTEEDRIEPEILSSTVIRGLDDRQTQLINRTRHGHMIVAGESLYTLEVQPAANAVDRRRTRPRRPRSSRCWRSSRSGRSGASTSPARTATSTWPSRPPRRRSSA